MVMQAMEEAQDPVKGLGTTRAQDLDNGEKRRPQ